MSRKSKSKAGAKAFQQLQAGSPVTHTMQADSYTGGPKGPTQDAIDPNTKATLDAFSNLVARLGYGSNNVLEGTTYENNRLSRDFMLLVALYRSNWIARKIVDVPAEDMFKNWYQLTSEMPPDAIDQLQKLERTTKTRAGLLQACKWGRLFGGGAAIIIIDGHEDYLEYPLEYDDIMPGSYRGLIPLDRWNGISPSNELIDDIKSPDFGMPAGYRVTLQSGGTFQIHSSRVLRFIGRDLPVWEKQAEMYWGISELEVVYEELKKRDNTSFNIAGLVFLANIRVLTLPGLAELLASAPGPAQQQLYRVLQAQVQIMTSMGMMVLPENGQFNTHQYTFSGLNDIYESFMLDVAGAAEMPVTKLFGRSPAGLNATGESDMQNYYDGIGQKQEAQVRPNLEKLLPIECISLWGKVPEDLDIKFPSSQTVPPDKLAETAGKFVSSITETYNSGLITQRVGMQELRQLEDATGLFSNITDEDIAKASNELQNPGEDMGGGLFGGGNGAVGEPPSGGKGTGEGEADAVPHTPAAQQPPNKGGGVRGLLAELRATIANMRAGKRGNGQVSNLKQQIAASQARNEATERDEELRKALRYDMGRLVHDASKSDGWVGVDLDGTLAEHNSNGSFNPNHIGVPIPAMVMRVKQWLAQGKDVRIFTARVANLEGKRLAETVALIEAWCLEHLGEALPVTCMKDPGMVELWDDRAVRVKSNTGWVVAKDSRSLLEGLRFDLKSVNDATGNWKESDHPRNESGKFTFGFGVSREGKFNFNYDGPKGNSKNVTVFIDNDVRGFEGGREKIEEIVNSLPETGIKDIIVLPSKILITPNGTKTNAYFRPSKNVIYLGSLAFKPKKNLGYFLAHELGHAYQCNNFKEDFEKASFNDKEWFAIHFAESAGYKRIYTKDSATPRQLLTELRAMIPTTDKKFEEAEHPRDDEGKFAEKGTAGSKRASAYNLRSTEQVDGKRTLVNGQPLPAHIEKLKIPPAWRDVQVAMDPKADLQARGVDAAGRMQYVYSENFVAKQAKAKFARIRELDRKYNSIQKQNEQNRRSGSPMLAEHADCMALVMGMGLRPGSEEDKHGPKAKVQAYGASTLEGQHVVVEGKAVRLKFVGKKGVNLDLPVKDPSLAAMLLQRKKQAGEGGRLFPNTTQFSLLSYSSKMDGGGFKTKDFRTHLGTSLAMELVKAQDAPKSEKEYKQKVRAVAKTVSSTLGNTPTVALQSYINPVVFAGWRSSKWKA